VARALRTGLAGAALGALLAAPVAGAAWLGLSPGEATSSGVAGLAAAVDAVGWVLVPQLALAVGVLGLALQQLVTRTAGAARAPAPGWIDPAIESALLLGLLGTVSGMVSGFAGLSPDALEPGPLVHSLGTALRSSLVGFGIALVGVWAKERPA
jgi:hypothetical protein